MKFTEAQLESAIIEFLEAKGYPYLKGELRIPDAEKIVDEVAV